MVAVELDEVVKDLKDMIKTDSSINETILLHGTNTTGLEALLHEGQLEMFLDPRFTSRDAFGRGVYFAATVVDLESVLYVDGPQILYNLFTGCPAEPFFPFLG